MMMGETYQQRAGKKVVDILQQVNVCDGPHVSICVRTAPGPLHIHNIPESGNMTESGDQLRLQCTECNMQIAN
jgi:hypothetical protein